MRGQRDRRREPDGGVVVVVRAVLALVRPVHRHRALDEVQQQEAGRERHHHGRDAEERRVGELEQLGEQVEGDQPEHHARREAQHEVQPVPAAQCDEATEGGGEHGGQGEEHGHARTVHQNDNHFHFRLATVERCWS